MKNLIVPGSLKNLKSGPIVIYYALYNNFLYTLLASAFVPQKDFYYIHDNTDAFFFFFFFTKMLISFWSLFSPFAFLLPKNFDIFCVLLFRVFLCVFDNSYLSFLYLVKEIENIFIASFICFKNYVSYVSIYMSIL